MVWIDFCSSGKRSVAIHVVHPSMHAACLEDHSRRTRTWRQMLVSPFSHFIIQTSRAWDGLFFLNFALAELRSRQPTRSDGERPATPARVKGAQIWTFFSANVGRAHHQTSTVSFKQAEKKQSFKAMQGKKRVSEKYRKQCFSSNGRDAALHCPEPHARAVIIQSVYCHADHQIPPMAQVLTESVNYKCSVHDNISL